MSLTSQFQSPTLTGVDSPAPRGTTFNGNSFDSVNYEGGICFILQSAAGTGTTPTLDVEIHESSDDSDWSPTAIASFTQVTDAAASAQKVVVASSDSDRYLRAVYTIAGTTPSFALAMSVVAQKQNT